ncbi:MAG: hypothetical protein QW273_03840 [Candidatus Pacearchaeota archaeon]
METKQFLYVVGICALVSALISIGVSSTKAGPQFSPAYGSGYSYASQAQTYSKDEIDYLFKEAKKEINKTINTSIYELNKTIVNSTNVTEIGKNIFNRTTIWNNTFNLSNTEYEYVNGDFCSKKNAKCLFGNLFIADPSTGYFEDRLIECNEKVSFSSLRSLGLNKYKTIIRVSYICIY